MTSKEFTALVVMDLSAAFDTVDHDILLSVLCNHFGITSNALSWFDTNLCPRQFYVNVEGHKSSNRPFNFSVPQGSCRGATLFMAYTSTLQYVIHQAKRIDGMGPDSELVKCDNPILLNGFEDDHSLNNGFIPNAKQAERNALGSLESCLKDISEWMTQKHLKMNSGKTEFMHFWSRVQLSKCKETMIKVCEDKVERSSHIHVLVDVETHINY